jgi:hypothetical protein
MAEKPTTFFGFVTACLPLSIRSAVMCPRYRMILAVAVS